MQATQSGAPVRDKGYVARLLLEDSHTTLRLMNPHRDRASVPADQVERLLRADRHKDESLAIVAHELRGPLGAVQNAIAVLRSPRGSDATVRAGMYELIDRQVRQMSLLTTGLLEIGRITRGELALQHSRIDLLTVLNNAVETVEPEFTRRRQPFTTNWSHSSVWVLGDASRLEQVFVNLLTNASKYTDEGGQIRTPESVYRLLRCRTSSIYTCKWTPYRLAPAPAWEWVLHWCEKFSTCMAGT
jgi:signal transduction histidine kinase